MGEIEAPAPGKSRRLTAIPTLLQPPRHRPTLQARNIMERLPKSLHASVRCVFRQAWELDDADKAERLLRNLAQRHERDGRRSPARSWKEFDEILTVTRLRLPKELRRSLVCASRSSRPGPASTWPRHRCSSTRRAPRRTIAPALPRRSRRRSHRASCRRSPQTAARRRHGSAVSVESPAQARFICRSLSHIPRGARRGAPPTLAAASRPVGAVRDGSSASAAAGVARTCMAPAHQPSNAAYPLRNPLVG